MNHGSTAMQCPPTPGPGCRIFTRGCRLASRITSHTSRSRPSAITDSRSEEHTSELQSLMRISYAVFCLKKKKTQHKQTKENQKTKNYEKNEKQHTQYTKIKLTKY